ncbi:MAG TPA: FkbM family methyltransferase [Acidimicrobiales bacterium]|nr:FkbM family methyltransferase [Acidimicrobiales bacterium]
MCEPTHAGAARVVCNLAQGLKRHGVESVVCTPPGALADWNRDIGIDVLDLPFDRRSPIAYLRSMRVIRGAVGRGDFTLIHAHSSFSGLLVRLARSRSFPPVVFQPHAWSFLALRGLQRVIATAVERGLARRTDMFVFVSGEELRLARAARIRCPRVAVIPNGIEFRKDGRRRTPPKLLGAVAIGCVARLTPQKGIDVLLHAMSSDRWPRPSTVEIVGDGPERASLESLAREIGVAEAVTFVGSEEVIRERLLTWDLFVFPSRYEAGTALALLEAANEGLPIVTTDVPGARMLLGDDAGRVVPVGDADALASSVANAVSDWGATVEAAERTRDRAVTMFTLERQIEQMMEVYYSVGTGREVTGTEDLWKSPGVRTVRALLRAPFEARHYRALLRMHQRSRRFFETLMRYFLKRGRYPHDATVLTPEGPLTFRLNVADDMVTLHEVFFREDYCVAPGLGVVVDVGTNIGISTAYFLTYGSADRCYAFEPDPRNLARLERHLEAFHDRLVVSDEAVGLQSGPAFFGIEPTGRYGGLGVETGHEIEVTVRDINEVLEKILTKEGRIDLLKIDVEGLELPLVAAVRSDLLKNIDRVYFEHHEPVNPYPDDFDLSFSSMTCRLLRKSCGP